MEQLLHTNMLFASSAVMYAYGLSPLFAASPSSEEYYKLCSVPKNIWGGDGNIGNLLTRLDLRGRYPLLASSLRLVYATTITIATMVGYSPNAFIKIFTKTEDVPPVQWRIENEYN